LLNLGFFVGFIVGDAENIKPKNKNPVYRFYLKTSNWVTPVTGKPWINDERLEIISNESVTPNCLNHAKEGRIACVVGEVRNLVEYKKGRKPKESTYVMAERIILIDKNLRFTWGLVK